MSRACARTWSGGPSISTAESVADPGCSTTIRSTRSFQTETRCSTTTRVAPVLSRQRPTASRTSRTPAGSRLAVGSSSRISPGRIARMPASARRCFCPPERADVGWSSGSRPSPTSSSASATRDQMSAGGTERFSAPKATSSPRRESTTWVSGSCCISPARPRRARGGAPSISRLPVSSASSASAAAPDAGSAPPAELSPSTPARAWSSVDLPAPEGPSSSTRSPGRMSRSRPLTAGRDRPACRQPQPRAVIAAGRTASEDVMVGAGIRRRRAPWPPCGRRRNSAHRSWPGRGWRARTARRRSRRRRWR